jgi:hypothetical protein
MIQVNEKLLRPMQRSPKGSPDIIVSSKRNTTQGSDLEDHLNNTSNLIFSPQNSGGGYSEKFGGGNSELKLQPIKIGENSGFEMSQQEYLNSKHILGSPSSQLKSNTQPEGN